MLKNKDLKKRRQKRVRFLVKKQSNGKNRLSVFRSGCHIYAQVIDDAKGITLASASSVDKAIKKDLKSGADVKAASAVGTEIAKRAKKAGVETVVFDRGSYKYHGRIKALADAARASGLKF